MRKTILMIIVAALLVLVGCDNVMTQSPAVTSSGIQSGASPVNTSGGQSNNSSGSESSYVKHIRMKVTSKYSTANCRLILVSFM